MSESVAACAPDDDLETVLLLMARQQIRRMPVCDDRGRLVGIVALADLVDQDVVKKEIAGTLADICEATVLRSRVPTFA